MVIDNNYLQVTYVDFMNFDSPAIVPSIYLQMEFNLFIQNLSWTITIKFDK